VINFHLAKDKSIDKNNLHLMVVDVSDKNSVKTFSEEFKKKFQRLDCLVNNAAIGGTPTKQLT
jgi:NADP-dependent 3-hydroxy acid dehydrogenase YdfG